MPSGKVKWYDAEKGFGFLSQEDGPDVYVHADALPEGIDDAQGRHQGRVRHRPGPPRRPGAAGAGDRRAASVARNQRNAQRKQPEPMVTIVEDLIKMLEGVEETYRRGRHPERAAARGTAKVLRALADELEL